MELYEKSTALLQHVLYLISTFAWDAVNVQNAVHQKLLRLITTFQKWILINVLSAFAVKSYVPKKQCQQNATLFLKDCFAFKGADKIESKHCFTRT